MPAKMGRSAPRPPSRLPERSVSVGTSRRSCDKAANRQYLAPVRESSGESRLRLKPAKQMRGASCPLRGGRQNRYESSLRRNPVGSSARISPIQNMGGLY